MRALADPQREATRCRSLHGVAGAGALTSSSLDRSAQVCGRQRQKRRRAAPDFALERQRTVMRTHNAVRNREAEARA